MDRRDFFRKGFGKAAEAVVKGADKRAAAKAKKWIRPPFAVDELEFLLACTRCNACIEACSYAVIFPLAARLGADVAHTPAMDLLKKGCHLCNDWPCVTACETNALLLPEEENPVPAKLAIARIDENACLPFSGPECGACVAICPIPGALVLESEKPVIDQEQCLGCGLCREACIVEDKAITISSVYLEETTV